MVNRKKIILFIVEGINDKTCLSLCLSQLLERDDIHFEITDGDITTKYGITSKNIAEKIGNIVKTHSGKIFKQSDYLEVIHLVDMDGAFIPDENVVQKETDKIIYGDDEIYCKDVIPIIKRNHQKQDVINKMITISKVWTCIPYSVYFFSCNMDHVLHKEANMTREEKDKYAQQFENKFIDRTSDFVTFFDDKQLHSGRTYKESWDFVRSNLNSLKRKTNFYLYLQEKYACQ